MADADLIPADGPLVLVTVGTDHHPFDRLLDLVASWAAPRPEVDIVAQTGHSSPVDGLRCEAHVPSGRMAALMASASAVVCHGGPSTIMEARAAGHVPIVMPRDPDRGEHVDDHQQRFVAHIAAEGLVTAVTDAASLGEALDAAVEAGPPAAPLADRPQARASIERIGAVLDDLLDERVPVARERTPS